MLHFSSSEKIDSGVLCCCLPPRVKHCNQFPFFEEIRQCITTMTSSEKNNNLFVCLFVCLFCLFSALPYYIENSPWSSKRTIRMKTNIVYLSAVPFLRNLHKQNCQQYYTNKAVNNKKPNSDAHMLGNRLIVSGVWEWGSDLVEYLRLCLQVPQSPGVVKTAQNQQNSCNYQ